MINRPTVVRFSIFLATVVASWGVLSLGSIEEGPVYEVGMLASQTFKAGKDAPVVDVVATDQAEQAARDDVEPIKETNSEIETSVQTSINQVFDEIGRASCRERV